MWIWSSLLFISSHLPLLWHNTRSQQWRYCWLLLQTPLLLYQLIHCFLLRHNHICCRCVIGFPTKTFFLFFFLRKIRNKSNINQDISSIRDWTIYIHCWGTVTISCRVFASFNGCSNCWVCAKLYKKRKFTSNIRSNLCLSPEMYINLHYITHICNGINQHHRLHYINYVILRPTSIILLEYADTHQLYFHVWSVNSIYSLCISLGNQVLYWENKGKMHTSKRNII